MCPWGTQPKTSIPFAAIPHDIAADPRLSPTDRCCVLSIDQILLMNMTIFFIIA